MRKYPAILLLMFPVLVYAQHIDLDVLKSINPTHPSSTYWNVTSSSAYFVPAGAVAGTLVYGLIKKDRSIQHNAYELCISIGASALITQALKYSINRQRPAERFPDEIYPAQVKHGHSFPSGHTSLAFSSATSLALEYKKWYIAVPAYVWAGTVGYSRMYRGLHYPSDVLAGAAVGVGSGILSHWLTKKLIRDKK